MRFTAAMMPTSESTLTATTWSPADTVTFIVAFESVEVVRYSAEAAEID